MATTTNHAIRLGSEIGFTVRAALSDRRRVLLERYAIFYALGGAPSSDEERICLAMLAEDIQETINASLEVRYL